MNYKKIYDNIIANAKKENRYKLNKDEKNYIYYENHHVIPLCMGGLDNLENLVFLTSKEHYICHKLLVYIYPNHLGIVYSFMLMSKYYKNAKDYQFAKNLYSNIPASEKTQEYKLKIWYETYCNEDVISDYINLLKNTKYNPSNSPKIHIDTKNNQLQIDESVNEKLKEDIFELNKKGCIIMLKKK